MIHITFLGTGSIIPKPNQNKKIYLAILIEIGKEKLFDIGPGTDKNAI